MKKLLLLLIFLGINTTASALSEEELKDLEYHENKASKNFEKHCAAGNAWNCVMAGSHYKYTDKEKSDEFYSKGFKLFEDECEQGKSISCRDLINAKEARNK